MIKYRNFKEVVDGAQLFLKLNGELIETESWQGIKKPIAMFEALDYIFKCPMPLDERRLVTEIKPNVAWADEHFAERVSGIPYNPAPSHVRWPYQLKDNKQHISEEVFSHTYPERFWPKGANQVVRDDLGPNIYQQLNRGIRFDYGDLNDVINLLAREPHTRQAYLPIWFPEDTGAISGQRVPCTLGYLFRVIRDELHITYKIRSCDLLRHFRDDIYMAAKLVYYIISTLSDRDKPIPEKTLSFWENIIPGDFKFQADSLHVFGVEKDRL